MARQLAARGRGRGTPYNPLVSDVMERVYGPTAGEDRPQLHPHAQPVVQTLVEIARNNLTHRAYGRMPCVSRFSMVSGAWYWGHIAWCLGAYRCIMRAY